MANLNNIIMAV